MLVPQVVGVVDGLWQWSWKSPNNRVVCSSTYFISKAAAIQSLNKFIDNMESECQGGKYMDRRKIEVIE